MTSISIYQQSGKYLEICIEGHSGYANAGKDIVCAAVSVLVINAINSIEKLGNGNSRYSQEETSGKIVMFLDTTDEIAQCLAASLVIGLEGIQNEYGKKYVRLRFKEV